MTAHVSAAARTSLRTVATTRSATGSTRRSISPASMRKSGRMRRQHTWSISRCSATATTRTPPASATSTAVRLIELAVLPRSQGSRVQNIDFLALRLGMFVGQLAPFSSTLHCSPSRRDAQPGLHRTRLADARFIPGSDGGALLGPGRLCGVEFPVALFDAASPFVSGKNDADVVCASAFACSGDFLLRFAGCQGKDLIPQRRRATLASGFSGCSALAPPSSRWSGGLSFRGRHFG